MKKMIILFFPLLFYFLSLDAQYNIEKRRQDSLLIYETYKNEIEYIKIDTSPSHINCSIIELSHDSITVCARVRLYKFNKKIYKPIEVYNAEGAYGQALRYPKPSLMSYSDTSNIRQQERIIDTSIFSYSIIYPTTKFIVKDDGKTKIPYVDEIYYNFLNIPILVKKLDPYTLKELK